MRGRFSIAVLALVAYAGCGSDATTPIATAQQGSTNADNVVLGLTHSMTTEGIRRAVLHADTAYVYEDSASMDLRGVALELYDETGRKTADLKSERGRLNTVTRAMTAIGNVHLVTVQASRTIDTEELHYDPNADRIWSDKPTRMKEGGTVLNGTGFTSDARMQNVNVTGATGRGLKLRF